MGTSSGRKVMNAMIDGQLSSTVMTDNSDDDNDSSGFSSGSMTGDLGI